MGGASLLACFLSLVAARACFASPLVWPQGTSQDDKQTLLDNEYPRVHLSISGISADSYRAFIAALREILQNPEDSRFGIPVLHENVTTDDRFVLVDLSNWAGQTVTLALDVLDAYVVGYRAGDYSVFLRPDRPDVETAITSLFTETTRSTLRFTGSYLDLSNIQRGVNRQTVELGAQALDQAVSAMYVYAQAERPSYLLERSLARAFLVTVQMISEAARFRYIEDEVYRRIDLNHNTCPDLSVIAIENSWGRLSSAIQESNQGIFGGPVQLQRRSGQIFHVDNVVVARLMIALMLFQTGPSGNQLALPLSPLIRRELLKSDDLEPMVQIAGPGGLCVDVRDRRYENGNLIQLYPCRSSDNVNQLWTFKRDGTLRSNDMCLGSYGYTDGDYIMIYNCDGVTDNFKWQVWDNGTIVSRSGLVLTAPSLESGETLTAESNEYTLGQSWLPSNYTEPLVAPIVALSSGLCLQAEGDDLVLNMCLSRQAGQAWALYPDGSIRPNQTRLDSCLMVTSSSLQLSLCDAHSILQRWVFSNEGTILNLGTDLVMDVTPGSIPSLGEIIGASFSGNPSQMWQALVLL